MCLSVNVCIIVELYRVAALFVLSVWRVVFRLADCDQQVANEGKLTWIEKERERERGRETSERWFSSQLIGQID